MERRTSECYTVPLPKGFGSTRNGYDAATSRLSASTPAPVPEDRSRVAPVWHTVVFIVVTLALTGYQAHQQPKIQTLQLRSRIPLYCLMIGFELIMLLYVWLGVRSAGKKVSDIIGGRWKHFGDFCDRRRHCHGLLGCRCGVLLGMRLLSAQTTQGVDALKALLPRTYAEMVMWVCLSTTAGFCEEFIFRGYLQRQFLALTGRPEAAVVFQALIFGAAHLYQGWRGAVTITVYGALFGALAAWRKSLRPGMMQHAAQDTFSGLVGQLCHAPPPLLTFGRRVSPYRLQPGRTGSPLTRQFGQSHNQEACDEANTAFHGFRLHDGNICRGPTDARN